MLVFFLFDAFDKNLKSFIPQKNLSKALFFQLNMKSFPSSFGPKKETKLHLSDLGCQYTLISNTRVEVKCDDWFYAVSVIKQGDFNADGVEDLCIEITDKALKGSYSDHERIAISRFSKKQDFIAINDRNECSLKPSS